MPQTTLRTRIAQVLLWISVLNMGIWIGGTLYMMLVLNPLWTASPPESVRAYWVDARLYTTIFNFFGPVWMPIRNLPILAALIACWNAPTHRNYLLINVGIGLCGLVLTLGYIYPINAVLFTPAISSVSVDAARTMTHHWIVADRIRFAAMFIGYLALLRAFSIPLPAAERT